MSIISDIVLNYKSVLMNFPIKIIMQLKTIILILFLLTLVFSKSLILSCGTCSMAIATACPLNQCYKYTGQNFTYQSCVGTACPFTTPITMDVSQCSYDYKGDTCQSKSCFNAANVPIGSTKTTCSPTTLYTVIG